MVPPTSVRGRTIASTCLSALLALALVAPVLAADEGPRPWTAAELGDVQAVASGSVPFVAVGSTGFPPAAAAWTSIDGLEWQEATVSEAPAGSTMTAVVPTEGGFVALGYEALHEDGSSNRILAWRSEDGSSWEPATVQRPRKSDFQAVASGLASGPAGELALGSFIGQDLAGQRLWHSTDGQTWSPVALPGEKGSVWNAVAGTPSSYLLMGQTPAGRASNWRSADGLSWKRVKDSPKLFDVAATPDGAAVGIGWKNVYVSPDLRTWEKAWTRPQEWQVDGANAFEWVEWDGSEFLLAGHDFGNCLPDTDECHRNPLLVSVDGRSWTEAYGPDGEPGADAATWLQGAASTGATTIVEGQLGGSDVVWLVEGDMVASMATE